MVGEVLTSYGNPGVALKKLVMVSDQRLVLAMAQMSLSDKSVSTRFRGVSLRLFPKAKDVTSFSSERDFLTPLHRLFSWEMAVEKHHLFKFHIVNMLLLCFTSGFKIQVYIYFHVSKYICRVSARCICTVLPRCS